MHGCAALTDERLGDVNPTVERMSSVALSDELGNACEVTNGLFTYSVAATVTLAANVTLTEDVCFATVPSYVQFIVCAPIHSGAVVYDAEVM